MKSVSIALTVVTVLASCAGFAAVSAARPSPDLDPEEVVQIQLQALQLNDESNRGIEVAFRFASPANKAATGPLSRFTQLFSNPAYAPMLNHTEAEYGTLVVSGNQARQVVALTSAEGTRVAYLFALTRQRTGEFEGSWMTDAVSVIGVTNRPTDEIPQPPIPEAL
jgi:hypothetical protein